MGLLKNVLLFGGGIGVLVYLAMQFQPGKNAKGGLNTSGGPSINRFLKDEEVPVAGTSRIEFHDGKAYRVTYKRTWTKTTK